MGYVLKKLGVFLGLFFIILNLTVLAGRAQAEDFQLWTQVQITKKFSPSKFTLLWAAENRLDMDASRYQTFNTTLGFSYEVFPWFSIGPYYRFEKKRGKPAEQRFFPELVFRAPTKPIEIKNRQRFEVRIFPDTDEVLFRYRNLTQFSHKFKTKPVSFRPFFQDEIFYQPQDGGFNENRLDAGNAFGFLDDFIHFVLYYRWQHKEESNGTWAENHILGTNLTFSFK
jgi:hypothetical protein